MLMPLRRRRTAQRTERQPHSPDVPKNKHARGRPMKKASELKLPSSVRRQHEKLLHQKLTAQMANERQQYQLSSLEALPVELIQQIFFHAFEVNMPRASPHLAIVLSKSSIYLALVLFAYFDDDGQSPIEKDLFLPAEYREISMNDKLRLQNGILGCRWCTIDLMKSCMPTLSRLQMVQAWHQESMTESKLGIPDHPAKLQIPQVANPALESLATLPPSISNLGILERHFFAKLEPPVNGDLRSVDLIVATTNQSQPQSHNLIGPTGDGNYLPRIMLWESTTDHQKQLYKTVRRGVSTLTTLAIPNHIIHGKPVWRDAKIEFLMLLRQGARFLPFDNILDISPAALFEGMASAIKSQHHKALLVLLELHFATMEPSYTAEMMRVQSQITPEQDLVSPLTNPIPLYLFHMASTQPYPSSSSLISLLLREGIDSIPSDDDILTAWAVRNSGDEVAHFLLKHMEGANDYGLSRGMPLFVNGRLNPMRQQVRQYEYPFPDTTFTNEIGYIWEGAYGR